MKRGEVWWVNFDPSVGGKIRKRRPAIIVSNNAANKYLNRVQVVPLTSKEDRLYPSESYVKVKGKKARAKADQIATVSKLRLNSKQGTISKSDMRGVDAAIKTQLNLN